MQPNRRALLRYGAACVAVGLAGCTDGEQGVTYPDEEESDESSSEGGEGGQDEDPPDGGNETDTDDGNETDTDDGTDEEEPDTDRRDPEYDATVGPLSDDIVAECGWFTREYDDAIDAFFEEVTSLTDTIESLEAMSTVGDSDIGTLEGAATRVEDTARVRIEPHYSIESFVSRINDGYLADIRRHGNRGDQEALERELASYRREYQSMRTQSFVDMRFPVDPIENRLLDWLKSPWLLRDVGSDSDFSPRPLFEFRYVGTGGPHTSFAYSEVAAAIAGNPLLRGDPASTADGTVGPPVRQPIDETFEVVSEPRRRRDELYVVASEWLPQEDDRYFTERLDSWPIYVQRYRSPDDAADAVQALLDGPVFLADVGAPTFGGEQWEQIFYRRDDRVRYAAMAQHETVVVVTAPSRTPIEDRCGFGTRPDLTEAPDPDVTGDPDDSAYEVPCSHWARPLTYTWLWNTTSMPQGGDEE